MNSATQARPSLVEMFSNRQSRMGIFFFLVMLSFHIGALQIFNFQWSWFAFGIFFISYVMKIVGVTMGYHRYFAHRSFKTSRFFQFIMALAGSSAIQGGVLWWAGHHRGHHHHSDEEEDLHSPVTHSIFHSHLGWMWARDCFKPIKYKLLDFARFPEIRFLNKNYVLLMIIQGLSFYLLGEYLGQAYPLLQTSGWQVFVWGFLFATVWTWHITFSINSICHLFGSKRYNSHDESRNNWLFAILAFGEGWHNNHHKYGWSARNGFFWWEWDPIYYMLKVLEKLGIVWDLRTPSPAQLVDINS
ncbi:MAG: acyl-CoA desaturase [Bdellovibrio sp. CG12_big_fil_rev_8_21_14_0_65_39_13]|nr:MAG: acyl-CoA desaturase [Bdellovibrio sp. CG22_combo_CG10-13_8_21_14_all_39_27]PIQ59466.1 MAG: acyl-CoA desaturase [Bdellovibrio sp. CG12_big_fil_rev_8_21_14_0_65_39_13]PIR36596.1 MAG: acyl-CoA desaturase [Bdellovibrio sp. CG11_big_fil_rev_8_21_14_0_20_39_38]PJB53919.1 MAG: acyl-CoA desaturase [Bdellovibrio sp. CG_4_9_14_3_um_filter_39_7]